MDAFTWKCIYQNNQQLYFTHHSVTKGYISDGVRIVREYTKENVTGCTYNGELIWLSRMGSNELICIDGQEHERYLPISSYDSVQIMNMVTGQKEIMVAKGVHGNESDFFLFDGVKGSVLCKLPIHKRYIDFVMEGDGKGFLLCEESIAVPAQFIDEVDDTKVLFFAEVTWDAEGAEANVGESIYLYIDNNFECPERLWYGNNLRFPLFDQYLWEWLKQKSFSSSGKYVIYYSKDIKGIIIGNPIGGKIHRIFSVPEEIADGNSYYCYNDVSEEFFILTESGNIRKYALCCDEEAIEMLNAAYDDAYNKKRSLLPRDNPGDMTFSNLLDRAMGSCICKPL